jgi:hypothetical protein
MSKYTTVSDGVVVTDNGVYLLYPLLLPLCMTYRANPDHAPKELDKQFRGYGRRHALE